MECHPGDCEPTSPVVTAEHKGAGDNGGEPDELDPECVELKRMCHGNLVDVERKPERPYQNV